MKQKIARAPAKLIISGEHAVLHGNPAVAMAINRYTTTTASYHESMKIKFDLLDLAFVGSYTLSALSRVRDKLRREYDNFLRGEANIRKVLARPFELLQYSVSSFIEQVNLKLPEGVAIQVDSDIPIGCGMGSSAAAIVSTLYALSSFFNLDWQKKEFLNIAKNIENLQHGKSSGLDLQLVTDGGCVKFQNGITSKINSPNFKLHLVNTGKPESSTGECVNYTRQIITPDILLRFEKVCYDIEASIFNDDIDLFKKSLRTNHVLLQEIGVVPIRVAEFIKEVEAANGAAKICGAGSVRGKNAGVVLVSSDEDINTISNKYGYSVQTIEVDNNGTTIT